MHNYFDILIQGKEYQNHHKEEEELVVPCPNTIDNPYAVVIHLKDASLANGAMMTSRWLAILALTAVAYSWSNFCPV